MNYFRKRQFTIRQFTTFVIVTFVAIAPILGSVPVSAAQITNRAIALSTSAGAATGVSYALSSAALPTTGTAVKSLKVQFCTTASGACTAPSGFSASSSTLASQPTGLGAATGWTVNVASANELRVLNASNATNPSGAVAVTWNTVTNPTANNTTFYGIITTYSDAAWTTPLDAGTVALSTSTQIQVALVVSEALTFCAGTSITGQNCGSIAGNLVDLGTGSTTSTSSGTSVLAASTNAANGYSVTVNGTTLTSGANTITALASGGASSIGSRQFGINLAGANTTPAVGAAISGGGTGTASANYGTNNTFRFATGEIVASVGVPSNANTFTVSYIANIDAVTKPGTYNTNLTYVATANF